MSRCLQHSTGLQALHAIASTCSGFLGPDKSIKFVTEDSGCEAVFTVRKLLTLLDIEHPCGQLFRDACLTHHEQQGSGCTTLVCMAGTWAKAVQSLLDEGISCEDVLSFGDEIINTCVQICRDNALDFSKDIKALMALHGDGDVHPLIHLISHNAVVNSPEVFESQVKNSENSPVSLHLDMELREKPESGNLPRSHGGAGVVDAGNSEDISCFFEAKDSSQNQYLNARSQSLDTDYFDDFDDVGWYFKGGDEVPNESLDFESSSETEVYVGTEVRGGMDFTAINAKHSRKPGASKNGYKVGKTGKQSSAAHGHESVKQHIHDAEASLNLLSLSAGWFTSRLPSRDSVFRNSRHFQSDRSSFRDHPDETCIVQSPISIHSHTGIIQSPCRSIHIDSSIIQSTNSSDTRIIQSQLDSRIGLTTCNTRNPDMPSLSPTFDAHSQTVCNRESPRSECPNLSPGIQKDESTQGSSDQASSTRGFSGDDIQFSCGIRNAVTPDSEHLESFSKPAYDSSMDYGMSSNRDEIPLRRNFDELCMGLSHGAPLSMQFAKDFCWDQLINGLDPQDPHICRVTGPSIECSTLTDGLVLKCSLQQLTLATTLGDKPLRAVLVNGDLTHGFRHAGFKGHPSVKVVADDITQLPESSHCRWLARVCNLLGKFQISLILVKGHIDSDLLDHCSSSGVLVISQVPYSALQYMSDVSDTALNIYFTDVMQDDVFDGVYVDTWEAGWHSATRRLDTQRTAYVKIMGRRNLWTLIICGPSSPHIELQEEQFWSSYSRVKDLLRTGTVCLGGGRTEIQVIQELEKMKDFGPGSADGHAFQCHTRTRIMEAFQEGLEEFVTRLELNRGEFSSLFDIKSFIRDPGIFLEEKHGLIHATLGFEGNAHECPQQNLEKSSDREDSNLASSNCVRLGAMNATIFPNVSDEFIRPGPRSTFSESSDCTGSNQGFSSCIEPGGRNGLIIPKADNRSNCPHLRSNPPELAHSIDLSHSTNQIDGFDESECGPSEAQNQECSRSIEDVIGCESGQREDDVNALVFDCLSSKIEAWQNAWSLLKVILNMDMIVTTGRDSTNLEEFADILL